MDKVFRVAHRSCVTRGMYRRASVDLYTWSHDKHRHPLPYEDMKLCDFYAAYCDDGYLFGYRSKEQAASWIYLKGMREALSDAGYVVYEMDMSPYSRRGEDYEYGDTQAMFNLNIADCVAVHEINDFFT